MRRADKIFDRFSFGGRVSGAIGIILAATIVTSLLAAFGSRHGSPLFERGALVPERVLHGEAWRLFTWALLEPSPLSLVFTCLLLYWFGNALADEWGSRHFLAVYFGVGTVAAVGTCLLALVDQDITRQRFVGSWPLAEAVTVAWGLWFPTRVVRIYFVLPITGFVLAWGTVTLTVVYAIYVGWEHVLPSLLAEGATVAWMYRGPVADRWTAWKHAREKAVRQERARKKGQQRMATVHVLYKLEAHDDDLPPLPPEVEGKIERILEDAAHNQRKKRDDDKAPT